MIRKIIIKKKKKKDRPLQYYHLVDLTDFIISQVETHCVWKDDSTWHFPNIYALCHHTSIFFLILPFTLYKVSSSTPDTWVTLPIPSYFPSLPIGQEAARTIPDWSARAHMLKVTGQINRLTVDWSLSLARCDFSSLNRLVKVIS